jgi:hypothetical protein
MAMSVIVSHLLKHTTIVTMSLKVARKAIEVAKIGDVTAGYKEETLGSVTETFPPSQRYQNAITTPFHLDHYYAKVLSRAAPAGINYLWNLAKTSRDEK